MPLDARTHRVASCSLRWIVRGLNLFLFLFLVVFIISIGYPNPMSFSLKDSGVVVLYVGLIVAWLRENIGGYLMLAGCALFVLGSFTPEELRINWVLLIFPVTAALHIVSWWFWQPYRSVHLPMKGGVS